MAAPSRRRTRAHSEWKVPMATSRAWSPTRARMRARISAAALLVNVTARICHGLHALDADQVRDAVSQHARLARARAGQDQQRPIGRRDGASLLGIQSRHDPGRERLDVFCGLGDVGPRGDGGGATARREPIGEVRCFASPVDAVGALGGYCRGRRLRSAARCGPGIGQFLGRLKLGPRAIPRRGGELEVIHQAKVGRLIVHLGPMLPTRRRNRRRLACSGDARIHRRTHHPA